MADELISFPRTEQVFRQLAEEVKAGYIKNLQDSNHPTRDGKDRLTDTITAQVTVDGKSFTASLRMNKYWEYIEYGTGPARGREKYWPNSAAIARWIDIKPVIPRPDGNGRIPTPKQLTFLISRKIHDEGVTGTHDFDNAREAILPKYYQLIQEALTADIGDFLWKMLLW